MNASIKKFTETVADNNSIRAHTPTHTHTKYANSKGPKSEITALR